MLRTATFRRERLAGAAGLVASRSERAILANVEAALTEAAGVPRRRRRAGSKDQETSSKAGP
jgi:hypothetical protein